VETIESCYLAIEPHIAIAAPEGHFEMLIMGKRVADSRGEKRKVKNYCGV